MIRDTLWLYERVRAVAVAEGWDAFGSAAVAATIRGDDDDTDTASYFFGTFSIPG